LLWVTQFGFSILFPLCFFLLIANWLQTRFGLGMWVTVVLGILGLLTTVSTVKS
jgi:Na+-transporting NADH:ubiquinone oxidoreductase subunit NqrE